MTRPRSAEFAIVGAGIAGLACAQQLQAAGRTVQLFDKGRRPGGRVATRRLEGGVEFDRIEFDHGAQYFTVRDRQFEEWLQPCLERGRVAEWTGRLVALSNGVVSPEPTPGRRFVGVPGMSALPGVLAEGLPIHLSERVIQLERRGTEWWLQVEGTGLCGPYQQVVCALPAPQGVDLLRNQPARFLSEMAGVELSPCWALLLHFTQPLPVEFEGAFVADSPLRWIANNRSKPGRSAAECWVLHASPEWSQAAFDTPPATVDAWLREAFWQALGVAPVEVLAASSQRWKFAIPPAPLAERYLHDAEHGLSACGDWCGGPRVEGAFLSGWELGRLLARG